MSSLDGDASPAAEAVRQEFAAHLGHDAEDSEASGEHVSSHQDVHRRALSAARRVVFEMRAREEIGDDAFHRMEEQLDWVELGVGGRG